MTMPKGDVKKRLARGKIKSKHKRESGTKYPFLLIFPANIDDFTGSSGKSHFKMVMVVIQRISGIFKIS